MFIVMLQRLVVHLIVQTQLAIYLHGPGMEESRSRVNRGAGMSFNRDAIANAMFRQKRAQSHAHHRGPNDQDWRLDNRDAGHVGHVDGRVR